MRGEIKNSQPSEFFDERHQNILQRQKLYLRRKTTTENTIEMSLCMMRSFFFWKNAHKTLTCCVVTLACLVATAPVISTTELNLNNSVSGIAYPASNQLKAYSCAWSLTNASSLVFVTLSCKKVKAVNNCSFFQIQLSIWHFHPQALSSFFRNFHGKRHGFVSHNAAVFLWTSNLYLPWRAD